MKKRRQLKWSMITILAVGWFMPLVILSVIIFCIVENQINRQLEKTIVASADRVVEICQMRINDVIVASKLSSYLPVVRSSYNSYLESRDEGKLKQEVEAWEVGWSL